MAIPDLTNIYNYRRLAGDLATSGQPTEEQLAAVAKAGFEVVINLAAPDDSRYLLGERRTVEASGMTYEHIPVIWTQPTRANLDDFCAAMDRYRGRRVYVHCAANMRVSAFVFLYRVLRLGWQPADAISDLHAIWEPNGVWRTFIETALADKDGQQQSSPLP